MRGMITRRRMLRSSAATGVGLLAAGSGFRVLGQDNQNLDLPVGSAGKLTVIHRTEYFEQAQNLFRQIVTDFACRQWRRARHLDDEPGILRRFFGQDDGGGQGRQSARHRLYQQCLDRADASSRPGRGRHRRGRGGCQPPWRHHAGHQCRKAGPVRGQVGGDPVPCGHARLLHPRRQARRAGHRSCEPG